MYGLLLSAWQKPNLVILELLPCRVRYGEEIARKEDRCLGVDVLLMIDHGAQHTVTSAATKMI